MLKERVGISRLLKMLFLLRSEFMPYRNLVLLIYSAVYKNTLCSGLYRVI